MCYSLEDKVQILLLHWTCLYSIIGIQEFQKSIVSFSHKWNEGERMEESQREMFLHYHYFKYQGEFTFWCSIIS